MDKTCVGCKFLYAHDSGYSNWTVLDTDIKCAKDKNPNLPAEEPYDWIKPPEGTDNWKATKESRCELYAAGEMVHLDVDGETGPADCTDDAEVIAAIATHAGVDPKGS
jgi:hypothetical protein